MNPKDLGDLLRIVDRLVLVPVPEVGWASE
jgi:hypothetical protein